MYTPAANPPFNQLPERDDRFDGLRALAVLAVVGCHVSKLCMHWGHCRSDFWQGACGAHLLLIASGFAMAVVLARTTSLWSFFVTRFSRVYPLYAISILIGASMIAIFRPPLYDISIGQVFANLSMCQSWLGQQELDGAHWLTGIMLKFYLLIGIAVLLRLQRKIELFAVAYLAGAAVFRVAEFFGFTQLSAVGGLLNVPHAHLFASGMILWVIWQRGASTTRTLAFVACVGLELANSTTPLGSIVVVGVMMMCFCRERIPLLGSRPLRYVGRRLSFGVYMLHGTVAYVTMDRLQHLLPPMLLLATAFATSLLAAELISRLFEIPFRNYLRNRLFVVHESDPDSEFIEDFESLLRDEMEELRHEVDDLRTSEQHVHS